MRAQNELNMSDKIIEGDLLRFSESNKIKTGEVKQLLKKKRRALSNLSLFLFSSIQLLIFINFKIT